MTTRRIPTQCVVCKKNFEGTRGLNMHRSKSASCQQVYDEYDEEDEEEEEEEEEEEDIMQDPFPRIFKTGSMATPNMRRTRLFKVCEFIFSAFEMTVTAIIFMSILMNYLKEVPTFCYYLFLIYLVCHHGQFLFDCFLAGYTVVIHAKRRVFG
ncbi:uncharacterized protein EV154DRAFT_568948 [Mucor mucedo]|uniref:uncharacterized protein n=1 Tax=Mucor mucedo TaxID=29922 RepID=UPI00221F3611|nr:uncharacterized protein EV154DRAFT_568948 [Mucor mucedo]KAI7878113.1 hypothetical protein EV154DRAFT_568948 [Mucor mucedo]